MKIVISDDERLVRLSLKSMIEDMNLADISVNECRNGRETLELVKNIEPEIALIDIKMPLLNGLEVIEEYTKTSNHTKFIITTGFSEFEYAKKSIELGVCDYLLKPINPEELSKVINKLIQENQVRLQEYNNEFQSNIVKLCYDEVLINEEEFNKLYSNKNYTVAIFYMDNKRNNNELRLLKKKLLKHVEQIINEMLYESINVATLNTSCNSVAYIFSYAPENHYKISKYIKRLIKQYSTFCDDIEITAILSESLTTFMRIIDEIEEIKKYSTLRIMLGINKCYSINELKVDNRYDKYFSVLEVIDSLSESCRNIIYTKFSDSLESLDRILTSDKLLLSEEHYFNNINLFLSATISFLYSEQFSAKWITQLCEYKKNLYKNLNKNKDITDRIMEFINKNYMYEISIATLSEVFGLTPNYISSLFHKRTSMKLVDYLAKVRINRAQHLLIETDLNVSEICKAVGYHSSRYFTILFKKITNVSPYEYRKRFYEQ